MQTSATITTRALPSGRVEVLLEGTAPGGGPSHASKRVTELFELPPREATDTFLRHLKRFAER